MASIKEKILETFLPRRCLVCSRFGDWFCVSCRRSIRRPETQICPRCGRPSPNGATHPKCSSALSIDGVLCSAHFEQLQPVIHAFKYQRVKELTGPLAEILRTHLESRGYINFFKNFKIVPIPIHPRKKLMRGFNQAELVALELAEKIGTSCEPELLIRTKDKTSQTELDRGERLENVAGCFACPDPGLVRGGNLLLLDDIATTGATIAECAKVLKRAGASAVWGLVLARD